MMTLTVGTHTHSVNGTNIYRDVNYLVRYTWSSSQAVTPTNQWGYEVTVGTSTNKVVSVNDRLTRADTKGTPFTSSQYVLSGHGLGSGTAGQFLKDYAKVGASVALSGGSQAAAAGKLFGPWFQIFRSPKLENISVAAKAKYNHYSIALLQSGQAGTGKLTLNMTVETRPELTAALNTLRGQNKNVLMCFGGSGDGGITITNDAQADQAFDSLVSYKEATTNPINFNGIDVDLEPSGSTWTQAPMVRLITRCKQRWGADFIIGLTPGLYGVYTARWMALAKALGSNFTYMSPMLYDFPESMTYGQLMPVVRDKFATMHAAGISYSKMMLALMLQPYSTYQASPAAVINGVVKQTMVEFPDCKGVILWEHSIESAQGYPIALGPVPGYLGR